MRPSFAIIFFNPPRIIVYYDGLTIRRYRSPLSSSGLRAVQDVHDRLSLDTRYRVHAPQTSLQVDAQPPIWSDAPRICCCRLAHALYAKGGRWHRPNHRGVHATSVIVNTNVSAPSLDHRSLVDSWRPRQLDLQRSPRSLCADTKLDAVSTELSLAELLL